jgi:polyphenol oxidase
MAGLFLTPAWRAIAQTCAPATGATKAFVPPGGAVVLRKAVSALSQAEINRLRLGYQRMRALDTSDPADPRGFLAQANVHCAHCGGPGTEVHFSWTFLPWHRMYLYFHERILMKLLNDNSFRLPYWDWDAAVSRRLPAIYRAAAPNSLQNPNRSPEASGGVAVMPPEFFTPSPMLAPNFDAFGGTANSSGALETGPHGAVHVWTGTSGGPDMGAFETAGRDPAFYAHHCNIDRLWAEWNRRNPAAHANPTSSSFVNRRFQFFDENRVLRRIRVGQVLNTAPLGFGYAPGAALSRSAPPRLLELTVDGASKAVTLPEETRDHLAANALAANRALVLEDAVLPSKSGLYNIFAGDPPATGANQAAAPNYLGYVTMIIQHVHERRGTLHLTPKKEFFDRAGTAEGTTITIVEAGQTQATKLEFANVYLSEE